MNLCKNYKTPELEIILIEDDILTGLGVSEVGGGGQPGFGDTEAPLYLEE